MSHHVIYVPGLGDHRSYGQAVIIQLWRLFGVMPHYLALGWAMPEGFDAKYQRLMKVVKTLHAKGHAISLVGVSAGASAVLNVFADTDMVGSVICVSGKINGAETIGRKVYEHNPDFEESMNRLKKSLEKLDEGKRAHIMSIHPSKDETVPIPDTIILGAKEKFLPGWSHASGIFIAISLGSRVISRFARTKV